MIVLRTPKGWTAPAEIDGHKLEGFWRSHQVPITDVTSNPAHMKILEHWMKSYKPEELFDEHGSLIPELKKLAPIGHRRISANPVANGGILRKELRMPEFRNNAVEVVKPGTVEVENTKPLGNFLRDIMRNNMNNFRVFGPDETASNRLSAIYEVSEKVWLADIFPEDTHGSELSTDGRVMEMLSEHNLFGWLEGYLLSGRHGFFHSYEAFAHVVDSMFNQHAKWLEISKNEVAWRSPISSENILLSSTVWRQDNNGFSHQDPGFIDLVTNKSAEVTRIYLPPDANCLLSVADHCLRSTNYVNVIVADKPVIFNFHGYPWLIHKLAYHRTNHQNIHVRGYKEKGSINTPLELAINNQVDRFNLVIDVIDRVPKLGSAAVYVRERMKNEIINNRNYAHKHGIDQPEIVNWKWPY